MTRVEIKQLGFTRCWLSPKRIKLLLIQTGIWKAYYTVNASNTTFNQSYRKTKKLPGV